MKQTNPIYILQGESSIEYSHRIHLSMVSLKCNDVMVQFRVDLQNMFKRNTADGGTFFVVVSGALFNSKRQPKPQCHL